MLRLPLLMLLISHARTAYVTDRPSFADRLDKLYEKLKLLNMNEQQLEPSPEDKLYAKLSRLNSLSPDTDKFDLSEDDEELLTAIQIWGGLSAEQMDGVVKDLQRKKDDDEAKERIDAEYGDGDWNDEFQELELSDGEYAMDGKDDWDSEDETDLTSSTSKSIAGITPSAFTRIDSGPKAVKTVVSAVDPIAATNERPRLIDDSSLTPAERTALRQAALANMGRVLRSGKCQVPQPRWLSVRQLAPSADTAYIPPCVQLHRCTPDSGCCYREDEVCAPIEGKRIAIPFYLRKANGSMSVARMVFFNHTECACVSRDTLQTTIRTFRSETRSIESQEVKSDLVGEGQNDWRPTEEPKLDAGSTAPPQLRRCTCPSLFLASIPDNGACSCICDWTNAMRRRDCSSFARGKEHFGLKDRVCVAKGVCTPPTCEFGAYDKNKGHCPLRRFRRMMIRRRQGETPT